MTATRKWSALTVLLVAAIFLASWYLLISPKRSEATSLRTQTTEQDAANKQLRQQLEVLKAQAQELPKQAAFLAQIRRQLPDNPALPALIRDLSGAATKSGVELVSLAPSLPVAVMNTAVAPAPAATTPAPGGTAAPGTPVAPAVAAPTLYQVPITVRTSGNYFEMEQFLNKIEGLRRSFLVSGFTLRQLESSSAAAATTGSAPEGLELEIRGRVFLSPEAAAVAATTGLPVPSTAPAAN